MVSSTFNKIGSPVAKNTRLEFSADKRVSVTLPNFGENDEAITGHGIWSISEGFVKIEWDDELVLGAPQHWKIVELTRSKLHWKLEMVDGIQEEEYKRKK